MDPDWTPHSPSSPPPSCPPSYSRHPHPPQQTHSSTAINNQSTTNRRVHHQGEGGVTIILKCPRVSSLHLFLSVYLCVMGGLGSVISGLWVTGHVYVLSHTSEYSLREQRYVDVCVGLSLLVSQTCLVYGARGSRIQHVLAFFILSSLVILSYWTYWACLYYSRAETEASKELWDTLTVLTLVYVALLLAPTVPFYKHLEDKNNSSPADIVEDNDKSFDSEKIMALPYTICQ